MDTTKFTLKIPLEIDVLTAYCIVANIQLACRHHKNVGKSREIAEGFARMLQKIIAGIMPDQAMVLEMGWDPNCDISDS